MSFYIRTKVYNTGGYDDSASRNSAIKFLKEVYDLNMVSTPPSKKLIDLVCEDDDTWGAEVEQSKKWEGNYWDAQNNGRNNLSGLGFKTINCPWWRKSKYWDKDKHTGWNKNLYVRCNMDFTCFIVVKPEVILDPEKCHISFFKTFQIGTGEVEEWRCFKREDVETWNLIDGIWKINLK